MSFIAAVLILNLDTADAFIAFSNLLNKPCQMAFFRVDHGLVSMLYVCPSIMSLCSKNYLIILVFHPIFVVFIKNSIMGCFLMKNTQT